MIELVLERVCRDQQETITKQSETISALLSELAQYRALSDEENRILEGITTDTEV